MDRTYFRAAADVSEGGVGETTKYAAITRHTAKYAKAGLAVLRIRENCFKYIEVAVDYRGLLLINHPNIKGQILSVYPHPTSEPLKT